MSELQVFSNQEFGQVRVIEKDGQPWFVGKDIADILGYERATKAVQDHVDEEDKDEVPIQDSKRKESLNERQHPISGVH